MQRIEVWVDCDDTYLEDVQRKLKNFLDENGVTYTIVSVNELIRSRD